jgi:hypothetical protein
MTLPEVHKKFREFFPGQNFSDYMDPMLTMIAGSPIIDTWASMFFFTASMGSTKKKGSVWAIF